jgi:hypothetical protein
VDRQASPVPQASVGADFDQTADVLVHIPPQVTFGQVFPVNDFPETVDLAFAQLVHSGRHNRIQVGFRQYLCRYFWPHAINAAEGYVGPFSVRDIYPSNSNHCQTPFLKISLAAERGGRWDR